MSQDTFAGSSPGARRRPLTSLFGAGSFGRSPLCTMRTLRSKLLLGNWVKNPWVCFFWVARVRSGRSGQGRQLPALKVKMHQEVVYAISKPLRNRITDLLFLLCSGSGSPGRARRVGLAGLASPGRALARVPGQSRVRGGPGGVPKNRHWKLPQISLIKKQNYGIFL